MAPLTNVSPHTDADRRLLIIAATWRVIIRKGISAASLRAIAAEMDATTGLMTRYFPEKKGLMLAALERAADFLISEIAAAQINLKGLARVEATVLAALPVSRARLQAWRIWAAFMAELPGAPELVQAHSLFPDSLRKNLIQGLRESQLDGKLAPEAYPPQLADMLLNQITGLGVRAVTEPARYSAEKLPGLIAPFFARMVERPD